MQGANPCSRALQNTKNWRTYGITNKINKLCKEEFFRRMALIPKWKPISEAHNDKDYLVVDAKGHLEIAFRWDWNESGWQVRSTGLEVSPTHFMELPEPPKDQDNDHNR